MVLFIVNLCVEVVCLYNYEWNPRTGGYRLTMQAGKFVASEIRPVFAEELVLTGLNERLEFDPTERRPLLWAKRNSFLSCGEEVARLYSTPCREPMGIEWTLDSAEVEKGVDNVNLFKKKNIYPVDVESLLSENQDTMTALVSDTLKRIKEMYDAYVKKCDAIYIGFSGGKDSVVLLDLCHKVLPLNVPVVFSDTDMELPDTYLVWEKVQKRYKDRPFIKVSANVSALENWQLFGPPSQALRWCCSVLKSTPAILALKDRLGMKSIRTLAFVGVRGEESQRRSKYDDIGDGSKSQSQVNAMPILSWSAHELWLYIFGNDLILNEAYRKGLPRVGCLMCPMSTNRQNELIRTNYPESVKPFEAVIRDTIDREFSSEEDVFEFIHKGGWHARKSGVTLRDVIAEPGVERKKDRVICEYRMDVALALNEWIKAIGNIEGANLCVGGDAQRGWLQCVWRSGKADRVITKWLVYSVHKAISCVGCKACEAECPTGALQIKQNTNSGKPSISIDSGLCIHCMRCYAPEDGCWRYYSKRYAGAKTMNISGINKYMSFGLKPQWIEALKKEGINFRQTTKLGSRMVPAAITWFREAGLIEESTSIIPTKLLEVGEKRGFSDVQLWQLLWVRLANHSPLVKWFITNTDIDTDYSRKYLDDKLAESVSSVSVRKGALGSLCTLIKDSPLCEASKALVDVEIKGRSVVKLTRRACAVAPLVILYGLYVMAEKSGHDAFTIRQMMTSEFDAEYISPLAVYGISPDEFKKQCMGLASIYPDYIACSFTLGLDEVRVFSDTKTQDDIAVLVAGKI